MSRRGRQTFIPSLDIKAANQSPASQNKGLHAYEVSLTGPGELRKARAPLDFSLILTLNLRSERSWHSLRLTYANQTISDGGSGTLSLDHRRGSPHAMDLALGALSAISIVCSFGSRVGVGRNAAIHRDQGIIRGGGRRASDGQGRDGRQRARFGDGNGAYGRGRCSSGLLLYC